MRAAALQSPIAVRLHGSRTARSAFASINRAWWEELCRRPELQMLDESDDTAADIALHHDFSTHFGSVAPRGRRRVAVRPWDFGPYPRRWVETLHESYDELWVHSRWGIRCAVAGGADAARVQRIPLGVDTTTYRPDGPVADLGLGDAFVFAFVGAAVDRKGADIALAAFQRAFGAGDAVALVVKDHTGDIFYGQQSHAERIRAAADQPGKAPIIYIDDYLPADQLAAILRRADAFLLPYRAEGFACTVLEAMACGTPPIVPDFGAVLDYCDATTGILVPPREVKLPIGRSLAVNSLGFAEHVDTVHFCEIPVDRLAAALRAVVEQPRDEIAILGEAAAQRARKWTWSASAAAVTNAAVRLAQS